MPLTPIQRSAAGVLRPFRSQESYVAGGAALNRGWPRLSDDTDIFCDRSDWLPDSVTPEFEALRNAGFAIERIVESDLVIEAIIGKDGKDNADPVVPRQRGLPALLSRHGGPRVRIPAA